MFHGRIFIRPGEKNCYDLDFFLADGTHQMAIRFEVQRRIQIKLSTLFQEIDDMWLETSGLFCRGFPSMPRDTSRRM